MPGAVLKGLPLQHHLLAGQHPGQHLPGFGAVGPGQGLKDGPTNDGGRGVAEVARGLGVPGGDHAGAVGGHNAVHAVFQQAFGKLLFRFKLLFLLHGFRHIHGQHHALLPLLVKKTEILECQRVLCGAHFRHELYRLATQHLLHVILDGGKSVEHVAPHQLVVVQPQGAEALPNRLQVGTVAPEAGQRQRHVAQQAFEHHGFVVQFGLGGVQGRHVA